MVLVVDKLPVRGLEIDGVHQRRRRNEGWWSIAAREGITVNAITVGPVGKPVGVGDDVMIWLLLHVGW